MPALQHLIQEAAVDSHCIQQKSTFQDIHMPFNLQWKHKKQSSGPASGYQKFCQCFRYG